MARLRKRTGLPDNLYPTSNGYYQYKRPDTGKFAGMGRDRGEAIQTAKLLNAKLIPPTTRADAILNANQPPFSDHLDFMLAFWRERVELGKMSAKTFEDYRNRMKYIVAEFGHIKNANDITTRMVVMFLEQQTPRMAQLYRSQIKIIFDKAKTRGLLADGKRNPVTDTENPEVDKQRRPVPDIEAYNTIYQYAEPWIKNGMDSLLYSIQRPADLVRLRFAEIAFDPNTNMNRFKVVQQKTKKHGNAAYLDIGIGPQFQTVIDRCRDDVVSPYILHYGREARRHLWGKPLTVEVLSKGFLRARNKAMAIDGLFAGWDEAELPTYYQIKALGIKIYEDGGKNAQGLAGHTERATTEIYKSGYTEYQQVITN